MAKVTITEAAKLAGISRTHLYRNYIKKGKLSLSPDEQGKPFIETSELVRVFHTLHNSTQNVTDNFVNKEHQLALNDSNQAILLERIKGLEALLQARKDELESYKDREKTFYRLLEDKTPRKKRWWPF